MQQKETLSKDWNGREVDLTFEQPVFSAFGAGRRLGRSIDQIVDQARTMKETGKEPNAMKVDEEAYKEIQETPGSRSKFYSSVRRLALSSKHARSQNDTKLFCIAKLFVWKIKLEAHVDTFILDRRVLGKSARPGKQARM